ncbi:LOW QUALITY PROTEIN: chromatin remodelling complex ATPase chain ISW [Colletotrichum tofieldiae]|nr:LOW QUALITY PROTEIN: chromatin remodelling complex ATPase chain ISW [Colletotrichum tofieldiae]
MRPVLLAGHERALTQIKYNSDGDLIFSTAKDQQICVWYAHNGERLGTYHGHVGAIWTVDVDPTSTMIASGSADNTMRLWDIKTGKNLKTWEFPTAVKRVEFNEDGTKLLGVTEKRMGFLSNIIVFDINPDPEAEQTDERALTIVCDESKATVAGFSYLTKYIIAGHEDGSVSQYDAKNGDLIYNEPVHELNTPITDLQWSQDRTYFITASKDKSAKLITAKDLEVLKTYVADTPLTAPPSRPRRTLSSLEVAAMDVTRTSARQGKFEARFYHKIFEDEVGRVRGHFGPLNTVAADPTGKGYASGGEDGYTNPNPKIREIMTEIDRQNAEASKSKKKGSRQGGASNERVRRTEAEEDAELLQDEKHGGSAETVFRESPAFIQGQMRDYQVAGLNWLISLHENGISGILADEMGLGKTLQTIAFLGYLRHIMDITGPHIVIVPKSTLDNWKREFEKWTPEVNVLVLQGAKEERNALINDRLVNEDFDVCITSYEMVLREKSHLKKFAWEYIIIDEAHRIKNEESSLAQVIRVFNSRNRLLITGTPLQNNLHELWALLNFLLPDVFGDSEAFDQWFSGREQDQDTVVQQLHRVLRPFLLRRVKSDVEKSLLPKKEVNVYLGMSDMQVKWYQKILEKDIDAVNGANGKRESKTRLLNIVMQLRKCCNHPYLFEGAEPGPPYTTDEHLVFNAGKMVVLDKLLARMRKQGSRVLIFSQMSRLLDILEDYCVFREYKYCRIDGGTAHEDRIAAIDEYNKPGSEKFIFLLTTRAGGLGINLTTADIVVLYDSDWNPQADLQAMDRAHRIGQTKQVVVYRFVTDNAIEEKVLERAAQKLRLDQLVIQQGRAQVAAKAAANKDELLSMIQHGAEKVFQNKGAAGVLANKGADLDDDDIDKILASGESRTKELNAKYEKLGIDDLQNFTSESAYTWNGEDFKTNKKDIGMNWINPAKRERKEQSYSMDKYFRQTMYPPKEKDTKPKAPRAPKQVPVHDYQFYPPRLRDLQDRETAYYRKEIGYKVPLTDGDDENLDEREAERALDQQEIDNATPLNEEEQEEKQCLSQQGFGEWNRRDFQQFINASGRYGRNDYESIAEDIDNKTATEVKQYAKVFWQRYTEIADYNKYIKVIEDGEERMRKIEHQRKLLRKKMSQYRVPLQQLKINYSVSTTNKKVYTEEEDRFLLVLLDKYGIDSPGLYEKMRDEIAESPLFRFDWFFLSRTPVELSRRCTTLLTTIVKEFEDAGKSIFLRSIDNPSVSKQYTGHTAQTSVARFSPSGFYVASGDVSGSVRVWDAVEAENTKGEYHIISGRINDIAWDGDSQRIIAVGDGKERFGHCITADSGNSVGEISGHSKVVNSVAVRQQRPLRAATVSDDSSICFLHGAPFKFNSKHASTHKGFLVTVGADKRIQLYDGKTGEPTISIGEGEHTGSIFAVSWAKDGTKFVTASADQTVKLWDVEAGKATQTWKFGDGVSVGDQQVGVVYPHGRSDGLIISLNLNGDLIYLNEGSDKPSKVVQGHNKSITALGASSDGKGQTLWSGSFDGRVCQWDVASGAGSVVDGQAHTNQVTQFSAEAGQTYSVGWDDHLRIVDESANTFAGESVKLSAQPKGVAATGGKLYVATIEGVDVYEKNKLVSENRLGFTPGAVAAYGSTVAVGSGNAVKIYTADGSGKLSETKSLDKSTVQISCLSYSKDGQYLAAGNQIGKIVAYKTTDWEVATDRWSAHTARVTCISWNDAATHAVSGALDTHVYVWSLAKPGSRVKALNAHKDGVNGVAWVEGGSKIASAGGDAAIKVWTVAGLQ